MAVSWLGWPELILWVRLFETWVLAAFVLKSLRLERVMYFITAFVLFSLLMFSFNIYHAVKSYHAQRDTVLQAYAARNRHICNCISGERTLCGTLWCERQGSWICFAWAHSIQAGGNFMLHMSKSTLRRCNASLNHRVSERQAWEVQRFSGLQSCLAITTGLKRPVPYEKLCYFLTAPLRHGQRGQVASAGSQN